MTYLFPWAWVSFIFKRLREFLWCFDNNRFLLSYSRKTKTFFKSTFWSDYDQTMIQPNSWRHRFPLFARGCVNFLPTVFCKDTKGISISLAYIASVWHYMYCAKKLCYTLLISWNIELRWTFHGHDTTTGPPGLSYCNKVASLKATPVWTTTESPTDSVV